MFENSSVMVLRANTKEDEVYKIEVDAETQNSIITSMSNALDELIAEKTQIIFDGSYKPNEDEILKIENYQLSDEIKDAIRDPLGVPSFKKDDDTFPEIKAIFEYPDVEIKIDKTGICELFGLRACSYTGDRNI